MSIEDIFEADGDVFDFPSVNRGLLILERNGETEKGKLSYQFINDKAQKMKGNLKYTPFSCNEDLEYHEWRVREEIYERTEQDIELLAFNIFRN